MQFGKVWPASGRQRFEVGSGRAPLELKGLMNCTRAPGPDASDSGMCYPGSWVLLPPLGPPCPPASGLVSVGAQGEEKATREQQVVLTAVGSFLHSWVGRGCAPAAAPRP